MFSLCFYIIGLILLLAAILIRLDVPADLLRFLGCSPKGTDTPPRRTRLAGGTGLGILVGRWTRQHHLGDQEGERKAYR